MIPVRKRQKISEAMRKRIIEQIQLKLKAPTIVLERMVDGRPLPRVFVQAALQELKQAQKLTEQLETKERK